MLEELIKSVPPITRVMCACMILLSVLTYIEVVQPYNLYFNLKLIVFNFQGWRLITNIFYFGEMKIFTIFKIILLQINIFDLFNQIDLQQRLVQVSKKIISNVNRIIICRFSSKLEEYTFRGNTVNYCYFLVLGIIQLTLIASFFGLFNLSDSFETMVLYLWCRRNKNAIFHVFGLMPIQAPYLTWFFIFMQLFVNESIVADLVGIFVSHVYYFFYDIYPKLPLSKGINIMKTPSYFKKFCKLISLGDDKQNEDENSGQYQDPDQDIQNGGDFDQQNQQDNLLF